jgi:hypothetical protein
VSLTEAFHHIAHHPVGPDPAYADNVENLALGMVFFARRADPTSLPES